MNWKRGSAYHIESDCGRYTVCKAQVFGTFSYGAWRDEGKGKQATHLGEFPSAEDAKACAEADAELQEAKA